MKTARQQIARLKDQVKPTQTDRDFWKAEAMLVEGVEYGREEVV